MLVEVHINYCLFQAQASKGGLSSSIGTLNNAAVQSITVGYPAQCGICKSVVELSVTTGCGTLTH